MFNMKNVRIPRKKVAVLLIFGLVLSIALYFYFSPYGKAETTDVSPDYKEMSDAINLYNNDFVKYSDAYEALAEYGNNIGTDGLMDIDELLEYESLLSTYVDASRTVKQDSINAKALVEKYQNYFQDYEQTIKDFDDREDLMENDMNNIVIFVNGLKGMVSDPEHLDILTELNQELVEIRDF